MVTSELDSGLQNVFGLMFKRANMTSREFSPTRIVFSRMLLQAI